MGSSAAWEQGRYWDCGRGAAQGGDPPGRGRACSREGRARWSKCSAIQQTHTLCVFRGFAARPPAPSSLVNPTAVPVLSHLPNPKNLLVPRCLVAGLRTYVEKRFLVWKWVLLAAVYLPPPAFLEGTLTCDCPFSLLMPFLTV